MQEYKEEEKFHLLSSQVLSFFCCVQYITVKVGVVYGVGYDVRYELWKSCIIYFLWIIY